MNECLGRRSPQLRAIIRPLKVGRFTFTGCSGMLVHVHGLHHQESATKKLLLFSSSRSENPHAVQMCCKMYSERCSGCALEAKTPIERLAEYSWNRTVLNLEFDETVPLCFHTYTTNLRLAMFLFEPTNLDEVIYIHIYIYIYIYICMCICVCVYRYIYIYIYTHRGFQP